MLQIGCPATSVTKYQCTLRKIPEKRKAQLNEIFFGIMELKFCLVRSQDGRGGEFSFRDKQLWKQSQFKSWKLATTTTTTTATTAAPRKRTD